MLIDTITSVIKSNEAITKTLDALYSSGRFPHAVLFEAESGIYLESIGIFTAMKELCTEKIKPCYQCKNCKKIINFSHPDLIICGENGEKSYNIDEVRNIRSRAFIIPNEADKTVFLLKNADTIPEKSQNALLKIIEEPPEHVFFIFLCENSSKLLETVLSRVTLLKFDLPKPQAAANIIKTVCTNKTDSEILSVFSVTNSISKTIEVLNGENSNYTNTQELYNLLLKRDNYNALILLSEISKSKQIKETMILLKHLIIENTAKYIKEDYSFFSITPLQAIKITDIIDKVIFMTAQNVNGSLLPSYILSQINLILNYN